MISSYFNTHPDTTVVYADFRAEENQNVKFPLGMRLKMQNTPASQVFDGLVLYREFTPMENACQTLE